MKIVLDIYRFDSFLLDIDNSIFVYVSSISICHVEFASSVKVLSFLCICS